MGSRRGDADERPPHRVCLDAFEIDRLEVSNAAYERCIAAGACLPPTRFRYKGLDEPERPVVGVSWNDAARYCGWVGRRLPTEAEWELAAAGTDGRRFPWGNDLSCDHAVYALCAPLATVAVDGAPSGPSASGALHMGGNAWEWVRDWWDVHAYQHAAERNPTGPTDGRQRAIRGGCWNRTAWHVRVADRDSGFPVLRNDHVGFRCGPASSSPSPSSSSSSSSSSVSADLDGDGVSERVEILDHDLRIFHDATPIWSVSENLARCEETTDTCSATCREENSTCLTGPRTCIGRYDSCVRACGNRTGCAEMDDLRWADSLSLPSVPAGVAPIVVASQSLDGGAESLVHLLALEGGRVLVHAVEAIRPPAPIVVDASGREPTIRLSYARHVRDGDEVFGREVVLRWTGRRFARTSDAEEPPGNRWPRTE